MDECRKIIRLITNHDLDKIRKIQEISISRCPELLHCASAIGDVAICKYLLGHGYDVQVNRPDKSHDRLPLHWACQEGYDDIVRELIACESSIDREDKEGFTPLHLAASEGHINVVTLLVQAGADVKIPCRNNGNATALEMAIVWKRDLVIKYLKEIMHGTP